MDKFDALRPAKDEEEAVSSLEQKLGGELERTRSADLINRAETAQTAIQKFSINY